MRIELYLVKKELEELPEILIVRRKQLDDSVPKLTWQFPNLAKRADEELTNELRTQRLEKKIGIKIINIEPLNISRTYPENQEIHWGYFSAEYLSGEMRLDVHKYTTHLWVAPKEVISYFTTSRDSRVKKYLEQL